MSGKGKLRSGIYLKLKEPIMLSLRYRSFCYGILITSITWTIALYLYSSLMNSSIKSDVPAPKENYVSIRVYDQWLSQNSFEKKKNSFEENLVIPLQRSKDYVQKNDMHDFKRLKEMDSREKNRVMKKNKMFKKKLEREGEIQDNNLNVPEDLGLIRSPEDLKIREEGYRQHAFNLLVSNRIGYHRSVLDTRNVLCKEEVYRSSLPSASIIICFYNEAKSALLRTVHSILDRTPDHLIHEILLIDDNSDIENLKTNLEDYIKENLAAKVKLVKTPKREGLIRARIFGSRLAMGDVLVFLDSHCEVNEQWLEPLLTRISENRSTVVCPIIDIINADTLAYVPSPLVRGGFNWGLHFKWDGLPTNVLSSKEDFVKPIKSPTMAGGLFAVDRHFFNKIGEYDSGMDIWGGENLEISFRIWMCGGILEIIPCSRVGHIFRRRRPYGSPSGEDTLLYNSLRVAHVWMDEYKENYFKTRPDAKSHKYGNITERLELRKKLQCKSFDWYLKNVYPELKPPSPHSNKEKLLKLKDKQYYKTAGFIPRKRNTQKIIKKFQIQLEGTNICIESEREVTNKGSLLLLRNCQQTKTQMWFETDKQELLLAGLLCLDAGTEYPRLSKCHEMGGTQEWRHKTQKNTRLYNVATGMCLGVNRAQEDETVAMEICTHAATWDLIESEYPDV